MVSPQPKGQRSEVRAGARYWGGLLVKRSFPSSSAPIGLVTDSDLVTRQQMADGREYKADGTTTTMPTVARRDNALTGWQRGLLQLLRMSSKGAMPRYLPIDAVAGLLQNLAAHEITTSPASPPAPRTGCRRVSRTGRAAELQSCRENR